MAQGKIYLDADGNEIHGTGAYLNDQGEIAGPAKKPQAQATIGSDAGGIFAKDPNVVTLADLWNDPKAAFSKMAETTKRELSNPRVAIPLAVGAGLGIARGMGVGTASIPQAMGEVAVETAPAAARVGIGQALRNNVKLDDVVEAIPGARTAKAAYRVGRGIQQAVQQVGRPVETADGPVTPPEAPPAQVAAPAPAIAAPVAAAAEEVLTPAEMTQAAKWHAQGIPPKVIVQRILNSRELTAKLGTATPDEAAAKVQSALHTGKF